MVYPIIYHYYPHPVDHPFFFGAISAIGSFVTGGVTGGRQVELNEALEEARRSMGSTPMCLAFNGV
jgi:hypothetical protein